MADIPMLQGWWDQIAPSFNNFSQKLPDIINPNRKYLQEIRQQLALNPELLRQYADMEQESPGTLERLGLGGIAKQVKGMSPSSGLMLERRKRENLKSTLSPDETSQIRAKDLGVADPLAREQARENLTATKVNTSYQLSATKQNDLQTEIMENTKQGRYAEAQASVQKMATYNAAKQIVDRLSKANKSVFKAYQEGLLRPEEMAAIQAVPEYQSAWEAEFSVWKEREDQEYRKEANRINRMNLSANSPEAQLNKERARVASTIAAFSPSTASVDDIYNYQKASEEVKAIIRSKDPKIMTPEESALHRGFLASQNYALKRGREEIRSQLKSNDFRVKNFIDIISNKKINRDAKLQAVDAYNQALRETYDPLVASSLVKDTPQLAIDPTKWRGNIEEIVWTTNDPDAIAQASSLGLRISGPKQQTLNDMKKGEEDKEYDAVAEQVILRGGNDNAAIEREIMSAAKDLPHLDKIKIRLFVNKKKGKQ